jgi:hypothetical protein
MSSVLKFQISAVFRCFCELGIGALENPLKHDSIPVRAQYVVGSRPNWIVSAILCLFS